MNAGERYERPSLGVRYRGCEILMEHTGLEEWLLYRISGRFPKAPEVEPLLESVRQAMDWIDEQHTTNA
jgi:hypothetical protein